MKFNDALFGALLLVLGLAVLVHVQSFPKIPGQNVGPALFPGLAAAGLVVCALMLIVSGLSARPQTAWFEALPWRNLVNPRLAPAFDRWPPGSVHAVAGIAHPERFFSLVQKLGIEAQCHPFPDHHLYARDDVAFADARAIVMTEKDAVKCVAFADERFWCLPVRARIEPALVELVLERLHGYQAA